MGGGGSRRDSDGEEIRDGGGLKENREETGKKNGEKGNERDLACCTHSHEDSSKCG